MESWCRIRKINKSNTIDLRFWAEMIYGNKYVNY